MMNIPLIPNLAKLGISGDPHGKISNVATFKKYLGLLKALETEVDAICILGDLFDSHAIIRSEIMNLWSDYFNSAEKLHILLVGNHDESAPGSGIHALEPFKHYKNVIVVDQPTVINGALLFLPFYRYQEDFARALEKSGLAFTYLFCHQTFTGAQFDNGLFAPTGMNPKLVMHIGKVISGDIHKRQFFANIWYPGTPYAMTFNDCGEEKALWVLDAIKNEVTMRPTNLPQYITHSFANAADIVEWVRKQDVQNKYKLFVQATHNDLKTLQESPEWKDLKATYNITLCPKYTDHTCAESAIAETMSLEAMVQKYIRDILVTTLDRAALLERAQSILQQVKTP